MISPTIDELRSRTDDDSVELVRMFDQGLRELATFKWFPGLRGAKLYCGFPKIVGVFLLELSEAIQGRDELLWLICGDLPTVYQVIDEAPNPQRALEGYCELMEDWIAAVRGQLPLTTVYPVSAAPTEENAKSLEWRIQFIRTELVPACETRRRYGQY